MKPTTLALSLSLCLSLPALASAAPLVDARAVPATALRDVTARVRAERGAHPERFRAVWSLPGLDPRAYRVSRTRRPAVSAHLRAMGADALYPMLDALLVSGWPTSLTADERAALEVGIAEALAALRDPRALPGLRAILSSSRDHDALRAAARGLAQVGDAGDLARLDALATTPGPTRLAAVRGLGAARDEATAQRLVALVGDADADVSVAAAEALASRGSSWGARARGEDTSRTAPWAEAMVRAMARADAAHRRALSVAIASMGTREALTAVESALATTQGDVRGELESLARMLRRSL